MYNMNKNKNQNQDQKINEKLIFNLSVKDVNRLVWVLFLSLSITFFVCVYLFSQVRFLEQTIEMLNCNIDTLKSNNELLNISRNELIEQVAKLTKHYNSQIFEIKQQAFKLIQAEKQSLALPKLVINFVTGVVKDSVVQVVGAPSVKYLIEIGTVNTMYIIDNIKSFFGL